MAESLFPPGRAVNRPVPHICALAERRHSLGSLARKCGMDRKLAAPWSGRPRGDRMCMGGTPAGTRRGTPLTSRPTSPLKPKIRLEWATRPISAYFSGASFRGSGGRRCRRESRDLAFSSLTTGNRQLTTSSNRRWPAHSPAKKTSHLSSAHRTRIAPMQGG
jgi:hypothetical protein